MYGLDEMRVLFLGIIMIAVLTAQVASVVIALISGVMIGIRDKRSRFAGLAVILLGIKTTISILSSIPIASFIVRLTQMQSAKMISAFNLISGSGSIVLDISVIFLFCLHFIKNYQTGKVHMIVALAARVVSIGTMILSNILMGSYFTGKIPLAVFVLMRLLSIATQIVVYIVMIKLFSTTKAKDPQKKSIFIFPMLLTIFSAISGISEMITTLQSRASYNSTAEILLIVLSAAPAIILIVFSFYMNKTGRAEPERLTSES